MAPDTLNDIILDWQRRIETQSALVILNEIKIMAPVLAHHLTGVAHERFNVLLQRIGEERAKYERWARAESIQGHETNASKYAHRVLEIERILDGLHDQLSS